MLSLKKKANKRQITENPLFQKKANIKSKSTFFHLFFTFSEVKVDFSHGGPVFLLDSRNFGKSRFFTFVSPFFTFCFRFSEVKVDFSHVGPDFLLDFRNFGKSTFVHLF